MEKNKHYHKHDEKSKHMQEAPAYIFHGYVASNVGLKRMNNEDNFLLDEIWNRESALDKSEDMTIANKQKAWCNVAVFDGMGGGDNGELASLIAAEEFQKVFNEINVNTVDTDIETMSRRGFLNANRRIIEEQQYHAMYGTTGTIICTNGVKFKVFHLGDSRAYLFRNGELYQLTKDQTLAAMKISLGFYEENDPLVEKEKHQLTEYIGCDQTLENLRPLESQWMDLLSGDKLLICSDGLYDMCSNAQIIEIMKNEEQPEKIAQKLLQRALENGGFDNITCLVLERGICMDNCN